MTIYSRLDTEQLESMIDELHGEVIECVDGCLLDNYLYQTDKGTVAVYETYLNCWTSGYLVKLPNGESESKEIETEFYNKFADELAR